MISAVAAALVCMLSVPSSSAGHYTIHTEETTEVLKLGKKGVFKLSIVPKEGFKVSAEAPLKITLEGKGVSVSKTKLGHKDKKDQKSEAPAFDVNFVAKTAGEAAIHVDAMFFVCDDKICQRMKETVSVPIRVEEK